MMCKDTSMPTVQHDIEIEDSDWLKFQPFDKTNKDVGHLTMSP